MTAISTLALMVILLLRGATLVTALSEGRAGVRRLFAGTIRWRMGVVRFLVMVTAMPLLTLLVGALTGTLQTPAGGWLTLVGSYLFQTFIVGPLIVTCGMKPHGVASCRLGSWRLAGC